MIPLRALPILTLLLTFAAQPTAAQCGGSPAARDSLVAALRRPSLAMMWRSHGLTIVPTDSIEMVSDSSMCRKAAEVFAVEARARVGEFTFALARVNAKYVAETGPIGQTFRTTFVFDSAMRLIVPWERLGSISNAPVGPPSESVCFGPEDSRSVFGKIRLVLTDPRQKWYRELLGLDGIPADSVHHEADTAMCARAIATIRRYFEGRHEHVQFTLFRVGRFHWAETSWPTAGEWSLVFILDSTATRVVGQY